MGIMGYICSSEEFTFLEKLFVGWLERDGIIYYRCCLVYVGIELNNTKASLIVGDLCRWLNVKPSVFN